MSYIFVLGSAWQSLLLDSWEPMTWNLFSSNLSVLPHKLLHFIYTLIRAVYLMLTFKQFFYSHRSTITFTWVNFKALSPEDDNTTSNSTRLETYPPGWDLLLLVFFRSEFGTHWLLLTWYFLGFLYTHTRILLFLFYLSFTL